MKNILIPAAAAAACAGALAQSSVTVYGRFDVSLNQIHYGRTPAQASATERLLTSDASMIGFRGNEDLGGGARAYFKLEHGFNADTGTITNPAQYWNREIYVGLGHARFGSVQMGSQYAPAVFASGRTDPFNRFGIGAQVSLHQGLRGFPGAINNAVQYLSPAWAGWSGKLLYAPGEGAPNGGSFSAALEYLAGPATAQVTYDRSRVAAAAVGLAGSPVPTRTLTAGATYDFGVARLHGWYQRNQVPALDDVQGYLLGITVPLGAGDLRASYVRRSTANAAAAQLAAGYYHNLSKRTLLYGVVGGLDNAGAAAFGLGPARLDTTRQFAPGQNLRGLQLGMRHLF